MPLILDTRQGLAETISLDIQYEGEKQISTASDGLPINVFFDRVPWLIKRIATKYVGDLNSWCEAIEQQDIDNKEFAKTNTGILTETVTIGSPIVYESQLYYEGEIVIADYRNGTSDLGNRIIKELEASSGSLAIAGYWASDGGIYPRNVYFSESRVGQQGTYSYTYTEVLGTIGQKATYGGVEGIITNISTSNPRYIGQDIYYDIVETVSQEVSDLIGDI